MKPKYSLTIEIDDPERELFPVYIQIGREGKHAVTKEIIEGAVFADYGTKGELLGVEMLEPCDVSVKDIISE